MILERIGSDTGEMLSNTWDKHRGDPLRKQNLFRGIAHLMLSLAKIPQPRIGSLGFNARGRLHTDGTISLMNRPLSCAVITLENYGARRTIPPHETYPCTEPFVADMLSLHENSFLSNPAAVSDAYDCRGQMAIGALLRMLSHHFIERKHRRGPFPLLFTDFHQSNIFVDDDWNITCVLDLEWVCALPPEMLAVPYWLTGLCLNELVGENLHEFNQVEQDFMKIFEEEEVKIAAMPSHDTSGCVLSSVMHRSWESDAVWFWRSISSTHATMSLLRDHICPRFARLSLDTEEVLCQYWCQGSDGVVEKKVNDYDMYEKELEALFSK